MTSPAPLLQHDTKLVVLDLCRTGLATLFDTVAFGTSFGTWAFGKEYDAPLCWLYECATAIEFRQFNDADGETVLDVRPVRASGERARWSADDCHAEGPRVIDPSEIEAFTSFIVTLALACLLMKHGAPIAEWLVLGAECPSLPDESANIVRFWMGEDA
jgi:hypothetical protein